jgi:hypothetical protein
MGYQFLILAISILCTVGMHGQSNVIPWTPKDRTELTAVTIKVPS